MVCVSSKSSVSEIVDEGLWVRSRTKASIAAIGIVRSGSERSRSLYVDTMLGTVLEQFVCSPVVSEQATYSNDSEASARGMLAPGTDVKWKYAGK